MLCGLSGSPDGEMLLTQLSRRARLLAVAVLVCTLLIVWHLFDFQSFAARRVPIQALSTPDISNGPVFSSPKNVSQELHGIDAPRSPPCKALEGGDDVLVVMRTGATEIKHKLPVHFNTTFQCYPNVAIFSDFQENFHGHNVQDALRNIPDDIKLSNEDFKHYQHVLKVGQEGLLDDELSGEASEEAGPTGKTDNSGWRLDKWKFLPMVNETFHLYPDLKWYVFVEPDSYLVWSNLLRWLPKLDHTKPLYLGSEVSIGEDLFAHGGSVFVLSRPAVEKAADIYSSNADEWHGFTANHWAGDCVLGKALHKAGVELTWAWPMFQGGNPSFSLNWLDSKDGVTLWCTPAMSYHHFSPVEVGDFWNFEQNWLRSKKRQSVDRRWFLSPKKSSDMSGVLRHRDTFKHYVLPNITSERANWNNTPEYPIPDTSNITLEACRRMCEVNNTCLQYAFGGSGCSVGAEVYMGQANEGTTAGWMKDRIESWMQDLDHCNGQDGWVVT